MGNHLQPPIFERRGREVDLSPVHVDLQGQHVALQVGQIDRLMVDDMEAAGHPRAARERPYCAVTDGPEADEVCLPQIDCCRREVLAMRTPIIQEGNGDFVVGSSPCKLARENQRNTLAAAKQAAAPAPKGTESCRSLLGRTAI
jgi:hypothetical protein